jgi:hypothetical protein
MAGYVQWTSSELSYDRLTFVISVNDQRPGFQLTEHFQSFLATSKSSYQYIFFRIISISHLKKLTLRCL